MLGCGLSIPIWVCLGKVLGVDHCPVVCKRWRASRLKLMLDNVTATRKAAIKDLPWAMAWRDSVSEQDILGGILVNVQRRNVILIVIVCMRSQGIYST